jgi:choline-sulfatase
MRSILIISICLAATSQAAAERPNVLFIVIDDLNDWVGPLKGHPQAQTPHLERLAARGTLFSNAHCQSPLCNPSRTSVMTGLRPSTTGIYGLAPFFRDVPELSDHTTLPQYLAQHGYHTSMAGKIYHGDFGRSGDEFHDVGPPARVGERPNTPLVVTPGGHPLVDWGMFGERDENKGDWNLATWAIERLESRPKQPHFLALGFFLPHVPCYATEKWFSLYPEDKLLLPPVQFHDRDDTPRFSWYLHWKLPEPRLDFLQHAGQWRNLVRSYLACVSFVDSQVGRVLDKLESCGLADNTIVVLWSDHGWHLGEKLITGKNSLWERSTRVPLIFAGPGLSRAAICHESVELLDIYPTLVELCGLPERPQLEGHSLAPQLRDATTKRTWPAITTHGPNNHAVRSRHWRYIRYADGSEELYDMRNDPAEWHNLADDPRHRQIIDSHRRWLPEQSMPPVPGSAGRVLMFSNDGITWEGEPIHPEDAVPGFE